MGPIHEHQLKLMADRKEEMKNIIKNLIMQTSDSIVEIGVAFTYDDGSTLIGHGIKEPE